MIVHALQLACAVFGIHLATREGMLLGRLGDWSHKALGWWSKPVTECPACMAGSFWCIIYFLLYHPCPLIQLPLLSLTSSGIAGAISLLVTKDEEEA